MTEQREKERIRQAVDRTLGTMEGDPQLVQRLMDGAYAAEQKRTRAVCRGWVMALAVMLCLCTAALAGGIYGRKALFGGREIQVGVMSMEDEERWRQIVSRAEEIMAAEAHRHEDALCRVFWSGDDMRVPRSERTLMVSAASEAELAALLADTPWLPTLAEVPEGFRFAGAEITWGCRGDGAWQLLEREQTADGYEVEWYHLAEQDRLICAWALHLVNDDGDGMSIHVQLAPGARDHYAFGMETDGEICPVDVPGMEDAMLLKDAYSLWLPMRRELEEPVATTGFDQDGKQTLRINRDVLVQLTAPLALEETLLSLAWTW